MNQLVNAPRRVLDLTNIPPNYRNAQVSSVMASAKDGIERAVKYRIVPTSGLLKITYGKTLLGTQQSLDVIFVGVTKKQRVFFAEGFNPGSDNNRPPTCFSSDSISPDKTVPSRQIPTFFNSRTQTKEPVTLCAQCPFMSAKKDKNGRLVNHCRIKKEAAVVLADDPAGNIYALNISASSMFGEAEPRSGLLPFQLLVNLLAENHVNIESVIIRISASVNVSFPQTRYMPVGLVDEQLFPTIERQINSEDTNLIVNRVVNYDDSYLGVEEQSVSFSSPPQPQQGDVFTPPPQPQQQAVFTPPPPQPQQQAVFTPPPPQPQQWAGEGYNSPIEPAMSDIINTTPSKNATIEDIQSIDDIMKTMFNDIDLSEMEQFDQ